MNAFLHRLLRSVCVLACVAPLACSGSQVDAGPVSPAEPAAETPARELQHPTIHFGGRTLIAGQRVRLRKRAGTYKPEATGYPREVEAGPGQVGTLVDGRPRQASAWFTPKPGEPIQLGLVRFDAQPWEVSAGLRGSSEWVNLPAFETTTHVDYLEVIQR